ncbi:Uncharacterised protein [uncultured archaeon]|nr:Uncharacterised protein [uncultured archaeon]
MKKVLIYENRKCDPYIYDISTPELEEKSFLALFNVLDNEWSVYNDLDNLETPPRPSLTLEQIAELPSGNVRLLAEREHAEYNSLMKDFRRSSEQKRLYELAKKGDTKSARKLLRQRVDYEYERWSVCDVIDV